MVPLRLRFPGAIVPRPGLQEFHGKEAGTMEGILARGQELVAAFGIRAVTALLILVVGRWVAKFLRNLIGKMMAKSNLDATLVTFVGSLV